MRLNNVGGNNHGWLFKGKLGASGEVTPPPPPPFGLRLVLNPALKGDGESQHDWSFQKNLKAALLDQTKGSSSPASGSHDQIPLERTPKAKLLLSGWTVPHNEMADQEIEGRPEKGLLQATWS